jgi:Zn-dependent protease with chaperone function
MDLNLAKVPKAYIVESGGLLGAFTTRFSMGDMLILHSDIVELAYEQGENAINFIIAHELAHLKRKHLQKDIWIICARIIVPLYLAYSRACETTCDNIATALVPEADLEGIILLLAGKKLYKKIDTKELLKTTQDEQGYFAWLAEIYSTHPTLANRLLNIRRMKAYMQI